MSFGISRAILRRNVRNSPGRWRGRHCPISERSGLGRSRLKSRGWWGIDLPSSSGPRRRGGRALVAVVQGLCERGEHPKVGSIARAQAERLCAAMLDGPRRRARPLGGRPRVKFSDHCGLYLIPCEPEDPVQSVYTLFAPALSKLRHMSNSASDLERAVGKAVGSPRALRFRCAYCPSSSSGTSDRQRAPLAGPLLSTRAPHLGGPTACGSTWRADERDEAGARLSLTTPASQRVSRFKERPSRAVHASYQGKRRGGESTCPEMVALFEINDYSSWKERFDLDPVGRGTAATGYTISRSLDNPGEILLEIEFGSADDARAVLHELANSPAPPVHERMTVMVAPTLFEVIEQFQAWLTAEPLPRWTTTHGGRMVYVTNAVAVNESGEPLLTRADVWTGLELKANNALPFVPAMTHCEVLERRSESEFDREVEFRGQRFIERINLEPQQRVTFTRLAGDVLGTIANEIEEAPTGALSLRFSYALVLKGVSPGSAAEADYAEGMSADYLKAVQATLAAMRRSAKGETANVWVRPGSTGPNGGATMSDWTRDYFDDVDNMRLDAYIARHSDDVVVRFGNNPPAHGKAEVAGNIGHFWSMINGLRHTFVNSWEVDGTAIVEADIDYVRKDGATVNVPCTTILHRSDQLVDHVRVYIDLAPVFAD